jgi:hypothetical protein
MVGGAVTSDRTVMLREHDKAIEQDEAMRRPEWR